MDRKHSSRGAKATWYARVPVVYPSWANWVFLAFFAFNGINNLRPFNVAFSSIPTAARDLRIVSSNQAVATTTDCRSIISLHPATIRIDKNSHCTVRRSRLRVSSFPNFLE